MRTPYYIALLLMSMAGTTMAQKTDELRFKGFDNQDPLRLRNHIEVDLGQKNALVVQFRRYADVEAHQNIDSALRLFVADYRKVADPNLDPTRAVHVLFRLGDIGRNMDIRTTPQPTTSFRFMDQKPDPILIKTVQDTLQLVWSSVSAALPYYDFNAYLLVNNLSDIDRLLQSGGINEKLQEAMKSVRGYKAHDLTNPKMAFDMRYRHEGTSIGTNFISPGLAMNPFISFQPSIGVGLIRNQWIPSLNLDLGYVPTRLHNVAYTVGYNTNFFFAPQATDGPFRIQRNDFLSVGIAFFQPGKDGRMANFNRQIASFNVGFLAKRQGEYFNKNTIKLGGTIYQKGFIKIQPELYMNGFFKQVYPGVRIGFGL